MGLPNNKGSYQARPMGWKIGKSKGGAVELAIEFALFGFWNGEEWESEASEIFGHFYITKTDGKLNTRTVETLEDVFGWNRADGLQWIANQQTLPDCQVALDFEEYEGKERIKVKWLNTFDRNPASGIGETDPVELKALDAQLGSELRATARKSPTKPAAAASANPAENERKLAWAAFKAMKPTDTNNKWLEATGYYFNGQAQPTISADKWRKFVQDKFVKEVANPIGNTQEFDSSEIPF